jgi:hypothetical protein
MAIPKNAPCILPRQGKGETKPELQERLRIDWNGVLPAFITTTPLWAAPLVPVKKAMFT